LERENLRPHLLQRLGMSGAREVIEVWRIRMMCDVWSDTR
jgi:hypothetical protein